MRRIRLTNSGLNRHGFRVLTKGGKLENFKKNPVMLYGHDTWSLPIGKWTDIKVEGDDITALPEFDETDVFALACKSKYEQGMLNGASIGFDPIATSSDKKYLLPGQKLETVTEWELQEASLVPIPSNPSSVTLSAESSTPIAAITLTNPKKMDKIIGVLGLPADATEDTVVSHIKQLQADQANALKARVDALLTLGAANGHITDANRETYRSLAAANYEATEKLLSVKLAAPATPPATPPATTPAPGATIMGQLNAGNPNTPPAEEPAHEKSFNDWRKKDPAGLLALKTSDPERYRKLAAAAGLKV